MAVNYERKLTSKERTSTGFEGCSLKEVRELVDDFIKAYGEDAFIDNYSPPYGDGTEYQYVWEKVPESDAQMAARIKQEEQWETKLLERERIKYEELKAKFEGTSEVKCKPSKKTSR